jgi:hypothetical protein
MALNAIAPENPPFEHDRRRLLQAMSALALVAAAPALSAAPTGGRTRAGHFTVQVVGIGSPEPLNQLHTFELMLAGPDGKPITGAAVDVSGQHRYALNPLPTSPRVRNGPREGSYIVDGLRFHLAGEWRLVFAIEFEQIRDLISLDILVK